MKKVLVCLLFLFLFSITSRSTLAIDPYATGSAVVSATILSTTINPPILVIPGDNTTSNNAREPLVWKRPSPLPVTPIHHYDVYLDNEVLAASVSDSITFQSYYFYTISRDGDTFYLNMTSDFAQGYHTWKVVVYDTSGTNASSETRTFYIDSVAPFINLQKVDHQTLNWNTQVPNSIPDINQRGLSLNTSDPLLTGQVEPYANMQIILMCPQNILHCQNQTWQGNYPTGSWQHRFYGLIKGLVYTVYLSTTDAAGNYTIFPEFFLAYGVVSPTPTTTITPIPTLPPTPSPSGVQPTPTPEIEIVPTPFIPYPPISPTPPIFLTATPLTKPNFTGILFILLVIGLPLHLAMTLYGTKTSVAFFPQLLFVLLLPFIGRKRYQTVPFATLLMYDPDDINHKWQTKISDIKGLYNLKQPLLPKIFVKISSADRQWKNSIIKSDSLPTSCLVPLVEDTRINQKGTSHLTMTLRSLPLAVAVATSAVAMYINPNYFYLVYLFLSLQFTFSEYLYPKISQ